MKKKIKTDRYNQSLMRFLNILTVILVLAALAVGFIFLDKYVKKVAPGWSNTPQVELVNPPVWINQALIDKITAAATAFGENIKLQEDIARSIQNNLERNIVWLQQIRVQTTHNKILVIADYRKPIALVTLGQQQFYVDAELVALDFVPMSKLPIVSVKGLPTITKMPPMGEVWQREDVAAAVAILTRLDRMDKLLLPDKPLLFEIDSIDVSNFKGRKDSRSAHISLYTKDSTEIIWGAEFDDWAVHLEAKDEDKLAKLYNYYKECGTLSGGVKYIDLRTPQGHIPLPTDKY